MHEIHAFTADFGLDLPGYGMWGNYVRIHGNFPVIGTVKAYSRRAKLIIKFIFPLLLLIYPLSASAGQIEDIFGSGVFGVKWGSSFEKVKSQFPEGKSSNKYGVLSYKIKDGRKLFGLERSPSDTITFSFDTNRMFIGVGIDFQYNSIKSFGELLHKLRTTFGESESKPNSVGVIQVIWPEDAGIKISLTTIPGSFGGIDYLLFGVERNNKPQQTRKEDLGF